MNFDDIESLVSMLVLRVFGGKWSPLKRGHALHDAQSCSYVFQCPKGEGACSCIPIEHGLCAPSTIVLYLKFSIFKLN